MGAMRHVEEGRVDLGSRRKTQGKTRANGAILRDGECERERAEGGSKAMEGEIDGKRTNKHRDLC